VIDSVPQMPECLAAAPGESCPAGKAVPGGGNLARFVCLARDLDRFAKESFGAAIVSFQANENRLTFETKRMPGFAGPSVALDVECCGDRLRPPLFWATSRSKFPTTPFYVITKAE